MGHYDDPVTAETECDRCGRTITYTWKHGAPEYCDTCKEELRKPEQVTTDIEVDVDTDTKHVRTTVTVTNGCDVPVRIDVQRPDDAEDALGIVGWLRFEAGDAVAENVWLQNDHVMDAGQVKITDDRSMEFIWTDEGVEQMKVPTMKYEGEIGQEFRDRVALHSGDPFDADEVTVTFSPTNTEWLNGATTTVDVPSYIVEL